MSRQIIASASFGRLYINKNYITIARHYESAQSADRAAWTDIPEISNIFSQQNEGDIVILEKVFTSEQIPMFSPDGQLLQIEHARAYMRGLQ